MHWRTTTAGVLAGVAMALHWFTDLAGPWGWVVKALAAAATAAVGILAADRADNGNAVPPTPKLGP
jgi:hypothetical protein